MGRMRSVRDFAVDKKLAIVGHCLVWAKDDRTPAWFYRDKDGQVSREVLLDRMRTYIADVAGRYRGKIAMWDVVNEAINDNEGDYRHLAGYRLPAMSLLPKHLRQLTRLIQMQFLSITTTTMRSRANAKK